MRYFVLQSSHETLDFAIRLGGRVDPSSVERLRRFTRGGAVAGGLLLGSALVARASVGEPEWISAMAQSGSLLLGFGAVVELVSRQTAASAYKTGLALTVFSLLLLGWVNGAVGIIGAEDNRANLMYGGVAVVALVGALLTRLRSAGMARVLAATAGAQLLVALIAMIAGLGGPSSGPVEILVTNGFFIVLFVGAAVLFLKAATWDGAASPLDSAGG